MAQIQGQALERATLGVPTVATHTILAFYGTFPQRQEFTGLKD